MKQLPGFKYDAKRRRVILDGYVTGTQGKTRRQKTVKNVTRDQALAAWKTFRADLESGRAIEGPLTLRAFVDGYLNLIAKRQAEGTRKTQRHIINNQLLRYFGDMELSAITTIRVVDFMADMKERSYSPSYINDAVRVLKMLLRQAVERNVVAEYPIRKPVPKEPEEALRQELDPEERRRFYAVFDDADAFRRHLDEERALGPVRSSAHFGSERRFGGGMRSDSDAAEAYFARFRDLREFFIVAVETGLRVWTDLRDLQWSSIDLNGGFIRVLQQKTRHEAVIPISAACRAALRVCRTRAVASVYVFVDDRGQRLSPTRLRRAFILAKAIAGITRAFRPHDLRHTFGCRLANANIGLQKIQQALGHTSARSVARYARPSEESLREIAGVLDADPVVPADSGARG